MGNRIMSAATQAAPARERHEYFSLARVMSVAAACALVSGLFSAASVKIVAALAGPAAIGLLSTLQQIRQTALVGATANGQTALVQGVSAWRGLARREYLRTVAIIFVCSTALAAAVLALVPGLVAGWGGLSPASAPMIRWLAVAVSLSSLFVFLNALLNALGASRRLALLQLAGPAAMALLAWPAARSGAFVFLLAASSGLTALAGLFALLPYRQTLTAWFKGPGRASTWFDVRHFFSISSVMLLTGLTGSAAFLAVRANILRSEGLAGTGQFDAAWNISMNQVSLVLASLQTHYLPALARTSNPRERCEKITRVLTLAAPASAVVIAAIACAKPFWLTLLYSVQFHPAAHYLRWTLAGDYLKVSSWIFSIPMLADADMRVFLMADVAASAAFLGSALALARFLAPAEAAAIAFVLMHAVHLAAGAVYVHLRYGFRWQPLLTLAWLAGLALVAGASAWKWNA
jgi:O-antigen/teichoic acid export membrane protein